MSAEVYLYNRILSKTNITDLLNDFAGDKAVFVDMVIPEELVKDASSINFYSSFLDPNSPFEGGAYVLNCRAVDYEAAQKLRSVVIQELHRDFNEGNYLQVYPTIIIEPEDDTDNYNAISTVYVKITN